MAAQVILKKYTGLDSEFGTVVKSLGIKRVDTAVPSVYSSDKLGGKVIPADDASEAKYYSIYRPDQPDCWNYSMECVFKVHLIKAPDIQLSNLCIYPVGEPPKDRSKAPRLMIGNSITYSKPTNAKSAKAVHDIWDYSRENPFYLTVSGLYGQVVDPSYGKTEYSVEYRDCGFGNVVYLDGERQPAVPVVVRSDASDITLTFKDRTFLASNSDAEQAGRHLLDFADALTGKLIDEKYVQRISQADAHGDGGATRLLVKTAEWNLMDLYPAGIVYKIQADREYDYEGSGYMIYWLNLYAQGAGWTPVCDTTMQTDVSYVPNRWFRSIYDITDGTVKEVPGKRPYDKAVVYIDVDAKCDETGRMSFFFNGVRRPTFLFDLNKTYHFINRSGSKCPLRFIGNMHAPIANNIDDVITDGVVVLHGNTDIEEIFVNPELVLKSGHCIGAYQCVCYPDMGNVVYNHPLDMCGNYNMCRVGGGIYNPRMAGESDYVYLQLQVGGECDPGEAVPQLEIGYDET
jgi:hypothetical protein